MNDRPRSACGTSLLSAVLLLVAAAAHADQSANTSAATTGAQPAAEQPDPASEPTRDAASSETSASAASAAAVNETGATAARAGRQSSLDLAAPDIRTVMPAAELEEPLPTEDQQEQAQEGTTVQVKGAEDAPDVPGGFGALWWALRHPSQAWRIFTPVE